MKCLSKGCKTTAFLMTVELCYPCSQLIEQGCAECGVKTSDGYALYCVKCSEPMREWVGLTDEEMESIWDITPPEYQDRFAFAKAVEAKLKEKNTCR
jgi:hypothetical protein